MLQQLCLIFTVGLSGSISGVLKTGLTSMRFVEGLQMDCRFALLRIPQSVLRSLVAMWRGER